MVPSCLHIATNLSFLQDSVAAVVYHVCSRVSRNFMYLLTSAYLLAVAAISISASPMVIRSQQLPSVSDPATDIAYHSNLSGSMDSFLIIGFAEDTSERIASQLRCCALVRVDQSSMPSTAGAAWE
jgi:hypothetical protein